MKYLMTSSDKFTEYFDQIKKMDCANYKKIDTK